MTTLFTSRIRFVVAMAVAFAVATVLACTLCAKTAFADENYEIALNASDVSATLSVGDTFKVTETIAKTGEDSFPMYALSTTVGYDTSALELVSCEVVGRGDVYSKDGSIVYNTYSRSLSGYTMQSGTALVEMNFKVLASGTTDIVVKRVNMSNYTGMRKMPSTATGLQISVGGGEAVTPEESPEGTSAGTATEGDKEKGTIDALVDTVKEDPTTALEDGKLTPDGYKSLVDAGMSDSDLVSIGFTQDELNKAKNGETVTPSFAPATQTTNETAPATNASNSSNTATNATSNTAASTSGDGTIPVIPIVAGVVIVAAIIAGIVIARKKPLSYRFVKRLFDIVFSLLVIVIGFIPALILCIFVAIDTKGTPIYSTERVGSKGSFKLYKFRSMVADSHDLEKYLNEDQLKQWNQERKVEDDPRITKLGRVLRTTSVDEFPQFLNVLAGQMSVIGPRAITRDELEWFGDDVDLLLSVRPGITGAWQTGDRNNAHFDNGRRQEIELEYVRGASLGLDAQIFLSTFGVMFVKRSGQ